MSLMVQAFPSSSSPEQGTGNSEISPTRTGIMYSIAQMSSEIQRRSILQGVAASLAAGTALVQAAPGPAIPQGHCGQD